MQAGTIDIKGHGRPTWRPRLAPRLARAARPMDRVHPLHPMACFKWAHAPPQLTDNVGPDGATLPHAAYQGPPLQPRPRAGRESRCDLVQAPRAYFMCLVPVPVLFPAFPILISRLCLCACVYRSPYKWPQRDRSTMGPDPAQRSSRIAMMIALVDPLISVFNHWPPKTVFLCSDPADRLLSVSP